jgi:6-pyruvoyltetrahydropterin/6-carboxytetrahydropterin synthase
MFIVSKEVEFDAGHRVPNHESKCRNPHGHRYKVRVSISGDLVDTPGAPDEGMLADFGNMKSIMMQSIHDPLDHGFIVYEGDDLMRRAIYNGDQDWKTIVFPYIPTAENLALWCYEKLEGAVRAMGFSLDSVTVWETPTSVATYLPEV